MQLSASAEYEHVFSNLRRFMERHSMSIYAECMDRAIRTIGKTAIVIAPAEIDPLWEIHLIHRAASDQVVAFKLCFNTGKRIAGECISVGDTYLFLL